jgi:hypothetical protein
MAAIDRSFLDLYKRRCRRNDKNPFFQGHDIRNELNKETILGD